MRNTRLTPFFLVLALLGGCQSADRAPQAQTEPDPMVFGTGHLPLELWKRTPECCSAQGKSFAVATGGTAAAQAAMDLNKKGCSVVDAAVAATFVLAVERPQSTGIGGGGFLTLHLKRPGGDVTEFVDFRETAPHNARADMFLKDGKKVENLSRDGVHSAGTPGFVAGLYETHKKYGSRTGKCRWSELLKPAIALAEKGFPVYPSLVERIEIRKEQLAKDPIAAKLYLPDGKPLKVGDILVQKDLAKTLRQIAKTGKQDFYFGATAKRIAAFIEAEATPGVPHVDKIDLANYTVVTSQPLKGTFQGYEVLTAPPPSAGGVALLESLNILSGFDLAQEKSHARYIHLLSETLLRSFADRTLIGDKQDAAVHEKLLTTAYADAARKSIGLDRPTPAADVKPGVVPQPEGPHTAHTSILDGNGNAMSVTTTVNFFFGSARVVPGTGIFLNDEMDDFATSPGGTNLSGLPDAAPNAIAPGKRPVSSMIPTIVTKAGRPVLVIGAAGSSTIVSGVLQGILNDLVLWPHELRRALFAGRAHKQFDPKNDTLSLEPNAFSPETEARLKKMGHVLKPARFSPQVNAVDYNPETGMMTAVHEPRDAGGAAAN